jgi:hypothetical protein
MGADIHGRVQIRYQHSEKWQDAGSIEDDRNYRVFAMLAGVRNGYGFAGCNTHEPLVPISEPRGLPADAEIVGGDSVLIYEWDDDEQVARRQWLGDHSHSWLTIHEIASWDGWTRPLEMAGVIEREEWEAMQAEGRTEPKSWSGGVMGPSIRIVEPHQVATTPRYTHVQYNWTVTFHEYAQTFYKWIQYMECKYGWMIERDPDSVRIIFGFDS